MAKKDLSAAELKLAAWASEEKDDEKDLQWDPEFAMRYPSLWVFLTWRSIGNVLRAPGRLSLSSDGTAWRVGYYDPSARRSCAAVGTTLDDALSRIDKALTAEDTVWSGGQPKFKGFRKRKSE